MWAIITECAFSYCCKHNLLLLTADVKYYTKLHCFLGNQTQEIIFGGLIFGWLCYIFLLIKHTKFQSTFFMVYVAHDFTNFTILQIKIQIRDRAELEYIWLLISMLRGIDCPSIIRQKLYFWNASLDYKSEKMQIPNIHSYVLIQLFLFQKREI